MQPSKTMELDPATKKNVELWLTGDYDQTTKESIKKLMNESPKDLVDSFYTTLTFGTGGLRGITGVGSNRMNEYTVRAATQGLANYLKKQKSPKQELSVFIGYDSRKTSRSFAEESAKVLAGNGIKVYLFKELRPTPLISFGCRYKNCSAAIAITASHNPPEYNGYKAYWSDGAQVLPPHDKGIIEEVAKVTNPSQVKKTDLGSPLINLVGDEIDDAYLKSIQNLQLCAKQNRESGNSLKIVYTSLHGTGITVIPKALVEWGFSNLYFVDSQVVPDGDFPTVKSPNPEEKAAMELGMQRVKELNADFLIATDPDADRVGVGALHNGEVHLLTGNQIACICLEHICHELTRQRRMPEKAAFIKTIPTTELFQAICDYYKKPCVNVLTGFKYIAAKIREWENDPENGYQYIYGGEESYGYLFGTLVRDKDAIISSALICEAALAAKQKGQTLVDALHEIYRKYGVYVERLLSVKFDETKEGKEKMAAGMAALEKSPPKHIVGTPVAAIDDFKKMTKTYLDTGKEEPLNLPKSDGLLFWLNDGSKLMIRSSGTEPKIKIYSGVRIQNFSSIDEAIRTGEEYANSLMQFLKSILLGETAF